jgi:hypothetical protein
LPVSHASKKALAVSVMVGVPVVVAMIHVLLSRESKRVYGAPAFDFKQERLDLSDGGPALPKGRLARLLRGVTRSTLNEIEEDQVSAVRRLVTFVDLAEEVGDSRQGTFSARMRPCSWMVDARCLWMTAADMVIAHCRPGGRRFRP